MLLTSGYGPGKPAIHHMLHLSDEDRLRLHGCGRFSTGEPIVAGERVTVTFKFKIGETEVPVGGTLAVAWRWPLDWGDLQFENPSEMGHVAIPASSVVQFNTKYHRYSGVEPWHHYLSLEVKEGHLRQGDVVEFVCGDGRNSGAGWLAPTCISEAAGFLMLIDPMGDGQWIRLVDPETAPILAGPPARLTAAAPSDVCAGEQFNILVRVEDQWGNVAAPGAPLPLLTSASAKITSVDNRTRNGNNQQAAHWFSVTFEDTGTWLLHATLGELEAVSNPIRVHRQLPKERLFWGDFHSGQCEVGCGQGSLTEHYQFARDVAGLQFLTHQANDHFVTLDIWNHAREVTDAFYEPGKYVPFLGCEWSPPTRDGGDRNVAYLKDEPRLRRSGRYFSETDPDPEPDIPRAPEFLEAMKDQEVLINMHVGGRPTNLDWHEPAIERLAEIHSTHGTSEWFIFDALQRGYIFGITAGTDGVTGRPGADHPGRRLIRNLPHGLTAVFAESLTREDIWNALKERRCYATTGPRILLSVNVNGHTMGSVCEISGKIVLEVEVEGTAPLERIDFLRGADVLRSWTAEQSASSNRLRVLWGGTNQRGTARAQTLKWDGSLNISESQISALHQVGLYAPVDSLCQPDDHTIAWRSSTAGNMVGVTFAVNHKPNSVGSFSSAPCNFEFRMAEVFKETKIIDAGGVNRQVMIGPAPDERGTRKVKVTFRDEQAPESVTPYWVRVTQVDQERAWCTPVYARRVG